MQAYLQYRRINQAVKCQFDVSSTKEEEGISVLPRYPQDSVTQPEARITEHESICVPQWEDYDQHLNPRQYSPWWKAGMTAQVAMIGLSCTAASAIDSAGVEQYSDYFGVSTVVGSMATGLFMIGFGIGAFISGPFSETFGRSSVYIATMTVFLLFIMGSGLAPNIQSHLIFRFIAGLFAATPLTCVGGTVADLWDPLQKIFGFTIYTIPAFNGPMLGQVIGSFIPMNLGWRWLEWIMLIFAGLMLALIVFLQPETYQDLLLTWKASALRRQTGQKNQYKGPLEVRSLYLGRRLARAVYRPFVLGATEPIIILMSLYLLVVYVILFLFLEGYKFIFTGTYGLSQGLTSVVWIGQFVGSLFVIVQLPFVYRLTKTELETTSSIRPETRLWFAMLGGAPAIPISLFWMAWTSYPHISVWSPIIASAIFGFGITTIFISAHLYVIDSYGQYSASALSMLVLPRYLASGGITIAGTPIYSSIGTHYTLTILGAISAALAFIPYIFYFWGHRIRALSTHAVVRD